MKFRNTYILAGVVALFGVYIYFFEIKKPANDDEVKTKAERIFDAEQDRVKSLEFTNSKGSAKVEKQDGQWKLTAPIQDLADEPTINGVLNTAINEKFEQVVSEGDAGLKSYGLDNPKMKMVLTTNEGKRQEIWIGNDAAITGKLYVWRVGDKKVLFANQGLKYQIDKSLKDLRDKRITHFKSDEVYAVDVPGRFKLEKKTSDWDLVSPVKERADQDSVRQFLVNLDALRATDFVDEKGTGLEKPELVVSLFDKNDKLIEKITLSPKKAAMAFAKTSLQKSVFQVYASSLDSVLKKADDFRDKKAAFTFKKDDLSEIKLKTSLADVHLVKKGSSWELAVPQGDKKVNQLQVENLISKLEGLKASEFASGESGSGLNSPKGTIETRNAKGDLLLEMKWGEKMKSGKSYYVKTNLAKHPVGVETFVVDSLPGQTLVETPESPKHTTETRKGDGKEASH